MRSGCLRVPDLFYALCAAPMRDLIPSPHCRARAGPSNLRVPLPTPDSEEALLLAVLFTALMYPYVRMISHGTHLRYVNTATRSFKDLDDMVLCTDPAPVPKLFSLLPLFLSWLMISW